MEKENKMEDFKIDNDTMYEYYGDEDICNQAKSEILKEHYQKYGEIYKKAVFKRIKEMKSSYASRLNSYKKAVNFELEKNHIDSIQGLTDRYLKTEQYLNDFRYSWFPEIIENCHSDIDPISLLESQDK